ncbi:GatB/YqeY domain-containing protein [Luteithermobacter gelatinilyticus]|uniref:GatB/YqeY domain-containing protein n=1 Tax=Luteithermobacter gelatinilyticus TaxID=2582913 RepID=UPI001106A07A|nr:GatB/YqeY domain-containing protein [Luteithermobacter gelatinilyticus]|tara:strand:+ start:2006 stop:2461 length:456 start_codon:yes stop_codon:yes gene_type:complete
MLRDKLNDAMKLAMKEKDKRRLATVRLILAAIKDRDISKRTEAGASGVSDDEIIEILSKMVKQRQESIKAYEEGGRLELAEQEREEMEIIQEFLPRQMGEDEIQAAVAEAITETQASGLKDIGKIMAFLKKKYTGQMDFAKASAAAKSALS